MLVLLNGCVTVRQPVHRNTQPRCSTEEVPFVVKPYVAQYLWLVTVFVNFCVPTFVSFSVCQCCKYAFFMCAEVVCTNVFLLSDHQIFVCFCLCWRTDKNKQKKKKSCSDSTPPPPPRPLFTPKMKRPLPPPPCPPPQAAAASGGCQQNHQLCTVMSTSFGDFLHFLHQQTFNIPLIVFSMHQKKKTTSTENT